MSSNDLKEHLATYADGELAEPLRGQVEAYLNVDPESRVVVQGWQALRKAAQRAIASEPLPPGMRERVISGLAESSRRRGVRRVWRIGGPLAAAALLVISTLIWWPGLHGQKPARRPLVTAERLTRIYQTCAVSRGHDPYGLAGQSPAGVVAALPTMAHVDYAMYVPDLTRQGYRLAGACTCPPGEGLRGVHAYYRGVAVPGGEPVQPATVVSFFSIACPVELTAGGNTCGAGACAGRAKREYEVVTTDDHVTVLKWDERAESFAVCSSLAREELLALVDGLEVAGLPALEPAQFGHGANLRAGIFDSFGDRPPIAVALAALAAAGLPVLLRLRLR